MRKEDYEAEENLEKSILVRSKWKEASLKAKGV